MDIEVHRGIKQRDISCGEILRMKSMRVHIQVHTKKSHIYITIISTGNQAYLKPATQGPGTWEDYVASRAVDGNHSPDLDSGHCAHPAGADGQQAWWQVDLGGDYVVVSINITNRLILSQYSRCHIFFYTTQFTQPIKTGTCCIISSDDISMVHWQRTLKLQGDVQLATLQDSWKCQCDLSLHCKTSPRTLMTQCIIFTQTSLWSHTALIDKCPPSVKKCFLNLRESNLIMWDSCCKEGIDTYVHSALCAQIFLKPTTTICLGTALHFLVSPCLTSDHFVYFVVNFSMSQFWYVYE